MFRITNLKAEIEKNKVLKGINLEVNPGEIHAVMGKNGSGKSTLARVIAGHPDYRVTGGDIHHKGKSILKQSPEERALNGIFLSFQYPIEIPGVNNASFLRMAFNAKRKAAGLDEVDPLEFEDLLKMKLNLLKMDDSFLNRSLNQGFSGGEKKRNEILQMALLEPSVSVLDEIDSGLDIDSLKIVAEAVNTLRTRENAIILITHYQRLLNYITPDYIHVIDNGRLVHSGDKTLALELEEKGYDWLKEEQE
ncbi:Fe-S cluster assembly ATPase SufC [Thermoproteota archaeon]